MEGNDQKTSKFSSGLNIIMRLDDLWKQTHTLSLNGLYIKWNLVLDRIWLELARDLGKENKDKKEKETEFEEKEKDFNVFEKDIEDLGKISDTRKEGFKKQTKDDIENRNKLYKILMRKQLFLARLENKVGKGTTYQDDDNDDLD